eukprot:scaffold1336_cov174-Amphora_coffeaeformis.AAC.7
MSVCASVMQTKEIQVRIRDNLRRQNDPEVKVRMHLASESFEIPVIKVDCCRWKFLWTSNTVGMGIMEVTVDGEQIPESPMRLEVFKRDCELDYPGQQMDADSSGKCICKQGTVEIRGKCVSTTILACVLSGVFLVIAFIVGYFIVQWRNRKNDSMWMVTVEELHFDDPPEICGQGSFGVVLLGEYRGTKVAIKRAVKAKSGSTRGGSKLKGSGQGRRIAETGGSMGMVESIQGSADPEVGADDASSSENSESLGKSKSKSMSTNHEYSLGFLASAFGHRNQRSWLPWRKNDMNQSRFNQAIFGSTVSIESKTFAARLCPWFNEQARREQEFITEMRTLSRLRHPCITTVSKYHVLRDSTTSLVKSRLTLAYHEYSGRRRF